MKILLLGAGGFIGANLTERLVNDGQHEITALDIEREKLDETGKSDDGTPMKLVDGGVNYSAYTYIDDAVDCIAHIIDSRGGVCDRQIFNIGTPENEVTIKELANKMCATFDKHFCQPGDPYPEIVSVSSEEFYGKGYEDCDRRISDVTKARKLVGWRSEHDLDSVLFHTMKYFVEKHRTKQRSPGRCGVAVY